MSACAASPMRRPGEKHSGQQRRDRFLAAAVLLLSAGLCLLPTEFTRDLPGESVKVRVLETDDSSIRRHGIVRTGEQMLTVTVLSGSLAGETARAVNHLYGKLELDKVFVPGDTALALVSGEHGAVRGLSLQDHYRLGVEAVLFLLFGALLVCYAGMTGLKSLLSFVFAGLAVWKILLPGFLRGWDPILLSLAVTVALSCVIIFLVSGTDRKGCVAFAGTVAGIACTAALALAFNPAFSIHGAVKPFAETLLYSGFGHLDLTRIFLGGIFLASSGAVMDLSMDIATAMHEIASKNPGISRQELTRSGLAVGRMVVGTMTTTLLLAYTGGFSSLLMVFAAQGTPILTVLNIQYVAAEIMHTLIGSFGLVAVAPCTAFLGGTLLAANRPAEARAAGPVIAVPSAPIHIQGDCHVDNAS